MSGWSEASITYAYIIIMRGMVLQTNDGWPSSRKQAKRTHLSRSDCASCPFSTGFPSIEDVKDKAKIDFLGKVITVP
jgi:hypothetical protein